MPKNKKHPGFDRVAASISRRQHVTLATARRELAAATRRDSRKAKRHNPRLMRVRES